MWLQELDVICYSSGVCLINITHCLHSSKTSLGTGNNIIFSLMLVTRSTLTGSSLSGFWREGGGGGGGGQEDQRRTGKD